MYIYITFPSRMTCCQHALFQRYAICAFITVSNQYFEMNFDFEISRAQRRLDAFRRDV